MHLSKVVGKTWPLLSNGPTLQGTLPLPLNSAGSHSYVTWLYSLYLCHHHILIILWMYESSKDESKEMVENDTEDSTKSKNKNTFRIIVKSFAI